MVKAGEMNLFQSLPVLRPIGDGHAGAELEVPDGFNGVDESFACQVRTGLFQSLNENAGVR